MFELRDKLEIKKDVVDRSEIFIIDDFYKKPDEVVNYLLGIQPPLRRGGGYNGNEEKKPKKSFAEFKF